jgi:Cdc6-like AAA superfamily ATPase
VYGPSEAGKTIMIRRLWPEFADRTDDVDVEVKYVNLKERHTIFSAANEILVALDDGKRRAYVGLDSVFKAIWNRLETYLKRTVLIHGETYYIRRDSNHDSSNFSYLRFETKASSHEN